MSQGDLKRGKQTSEKRSGMEEDERQPVMARLAAWFRRSDSVILVMFKRGNHPGKA